MKIGSLAIVMLLVTNVSVAADKLAEAKPRETKPWPSSLTTNANIFDGRNQKLADVMTGLVESTPRKTLKVVTDRDNLTIIMKDGEIHRNTIH